jgi:hypothetical protein
VRALVLLLALSATARATTVSIELYTMGPGEELFSTFGHAAICVRPTRDDWTRCYNYGTADFRTPLPLTWSFVRGRALFWVSVLDADSMLSYYASVNRAVWRQVLPLSPAEAARLAAALEASTDERVKYYRYHHFTDNCTTRIRDLVDDSLDGKLRRGTRPGTRSFRQWARLGFAGNWPLLAAVELLLGRSADPPADTWQAMFLPSELRAEVAAQLHAPAVQIIPSTRTPQPGAPWAGELAFVIAGSMLAAGIVLRRRAGLIVSGLVLGLVGTILWLLFALSNFPELTRNENLLAYWPTDFALGFLPERWRRPYLTARLVVIAVAIVLHLGPFVQPLATLMLAALPLVTARARKLR